MREYEIHIRDDNNITNEDIFNASELINYNFYHNYNKIKESQLGVQEKIDKIVILKTFIDNKIGKALELKGIKNDFTIDGAIKLNEIELNKLFSMLKVVNGTYDINNIISDMKKDLFIERGNNYCFRNKYYYFLFDSLDIEKTEKFTSINDFLINNVDIEKFEKDIYSYYNRIDQYLKLFSTYFLKQIGEKIHIDNSNKIENFCLKLDKKIKQIENFDYNISESKEFNDKLNKQNQHAIYILKTFKQLINEAQKSKNPHFIFKLIIFITENKSDFDYVKNTFYIDINIIIGEYFESKDVPTVITKMLLGLLDAKINIIAFVQNITQIITNTNFINPDFDGDLVLKKEQVDYLNQKHPEGIIKFRDAQEKIISTGANTNLAVELENNISSYLSILIGDQPEGYLHSIGSENTLTIDEINTGYTSKTPLIFHSTFLLLKELYKLINDYGAILDKKENKNFKVAMKKYKKKIRSYEKSVDLKKHLIYNIKKPNKPDKKTALSNKNYKDCINVINKKLIRLHREENNPLTNIKTAQNAYNHIYEKGYTSNTPLHILSVNYGGSLTGYYTKFIFQRLLGSQSLITLGNIVYSIYDLKNANKFLSMIDYPFKNFMNDESKQYFKENSHLIIFDDNTSSGKTLYNISNLADKSGFYGEIDAFACRASTNHESYDSSIPEEFCLDLIINSATKVRKVKFGKLRRAYKELTGTIIGESLRKEKNM